MPAYCLLTFFSYTLVILFFFFCYLPPHIEFLFGLKSYDIARKFIIRITVKTIAQPVQKTPQSNNYSHVVVGSWVGESASY